MSPEAYHLFQRELMDRRADSPAASRGSGLEFLLKCLVAMLILWALSGCATVKPEVITQRCEAPIVPTTPQYPVLSLKRSATDAETAQAYAESFLSCKAHAEDLESRLRALNK